MAEKRTYEVVTIIDPTATEEAIATLIQNLTQTIESQGATIVKSESMGRRKLAYEIDHITEGNYWLFEIDGTGSEIAELERRMRINEAFIRYLTIRVDLDRRRAEKFKTKRTRRAARRTQIRSNRQPQQQQPMFARDRDEIEGEEDIEA
ncbi:MAG: 30S ribosomal protein S6 [Pyrinomonadaceae bacterium]|nr:30S ribosomal protein S6 [Pyrinomonadaceae bacterium]